MLKAVIIDDEKNGRNTLIGLLENYCPEVEIIGEANNVKTGIEAIKKWQPDVVFLDIEMPDGTGFDLLSQIDSIDFEVVFVTAYDNYAIKAFQCSAVDYLLKPIDNKLLISSVQKLKKTSNVKGLDEKIDTLLGNTKRLNKLVVPTTEGIHIVKIENIIRCSADDYYTVFHLKDNVKITVSKTLKEYSEILENLSFFRTHQSHLINLEYVDRFVNADGGYIVMQNGDQVVVSRRRKKLLLDTLLK